MRGRTITWLLPFALAAVAGVSAAMAATTTPTARGTVNAAARTPYGTILVSSTGRTLYRYTVDSKHVNRCSGDPTCSKYWPPLLVKASAKPTAGAGVKPSLLGTIKARNGMRQVTYEGFPLYFFAGDKKAGQIKGEDFLKVWYVVSPAGALVKHASSSGGGGGGGGGGDNGGSGTTTTTGTTTTSESWG